MYFLCYIIWFCWFFFVFWESATQRRTPGYYDTPGYCVVHQMKEKWNFCEFTINLHKLAEIMFETRFQNSVYKFCVPHVVLPDEEKKKNQNRSTNEGEVAFFVILHARTDTHTHTYMYAHTYGARFIVPSRTSFGGDNKCHCQWRIKYSLMHIKYILDV